MSGATAFLHFFSKLTRMKQYLHPSKGTRNYSIQRKAEANGGREKITSAFSPHQPIQYRNRNYDQILHDEFIFLLLILFNVVLLISVTFQLQQEEKKGVYKKSFHIMLMSE